MRSRSKQVRGRASATNVDVVDYKFYLDSQGGVPRKGNVLKLNCAMSELLGKSEPWNDQEKMGNPADSAEVRAYLKHAREEPRKVSVTAQQARPVLAVLLALVWYMRWSAAQVRTVKERVERSRDITLFVTAFYTVQRGLGLSHAPAAQVLALARGAGLIYSSHFGKTLRESSLAAVVRRKRDCNETATSCTPYGQCRILHS